MSGLFREPVRAEPVIIATVSVWEAIAILTGFVPTVTSVVMRTPRLLRGLIVGLVGWWMTVHFQVHVNEKGQIVIGEPE